MGTEDLCRSTLALNMRFNDKNIDETYRNSLFTVPKEA